MELRLDYNHKVTLEKLVNFALNEALIQTVDFKIWSRIINGIEWMSERFISLKLVQTFMNEKMVKLHVNLNG